MFKKWWEYIKSWFKKTSDDMMDPEIEIQMAIDQAKKKNQDLRNQAANIVAHRTQLESKIEKAADEVGETREMAKQAILKAEEARAAGDAAGVTKWTNIAQGQATKLQAAENNLTSLKNQYGTSIAQAEEAKSAVQANAVKLQELSAKQMQLLGALEQAKMQESVNEAVQSMSTTLDDQLPTLESVEDKIEKRKAQAMAKAEIFDATPEGGELELRQAMNEAQADAKLEELKAELGLTTGGEATQADDVGEATGFEA
ncbi:MAG: PspA/IM30 family protein [Actinomycetota bacterium]|nr:PspA/IM30 family protein [Actinomycetota bacterium]